MIAPGSFIIASIGENNEAVIPQAPASNTIQLKYAQFDPLVSLPAIPDGLRSQPPLILLVDDDDGTISPLSNMPYELDWMNILDDYGWTFTHWDINAYGTPTVDDMNSHTIVVWFAAFGYPQIGAADRAQLKLYLDQTVTPMGTRPMLFLSGQDIGWDMCDAAGTDRDVAWFEYYTKSRYKGDDADGGGGTEVGNFKIIDFLQSPNAYIDLEVQEEFPQPFLPDDLTVLSGGTATIGYSAHAHGGNCGGVSQTGGGTGGQARIVYHGFAHDMIDEDNDGSYQYPFPIIDMARAGMLDEIIQWLVGGNHPSIELTYPTGGENISGIVAVTWSVVGADSIDLYYSANDGQAWFPLATGLAGAATSYSWDTASLLPGNQYKVKVVATNVATYANLTDDSESSTFTISPSGVPYDTNLTGLSAGDWAFVSFPIAISGNIENILNDTVYGDGNTTWDAAKWFDGATKNWKSHRMGSTVNTFTQLDNAMGVWLHLTANGGDMMLTTGLGGYVSGEPVNISLYAGWNMVGYPSLTERTVADALSGTGADMVEAFDPVSPYITEVGPTYMMKPGEAYWVRVPADTVWTVDW